jgi:hypothetical protein
MKDTVLYQHSATVGPDGTLVHGTQDTQAFVLNEYPNGDVAIVAFPVGGPVQFATVRAYDPEDPYLVVGGTYIREPGDPPDFSDRFALANHPEMAALVAQQTRERNEAPADQREDLAERHRQQQDELRGRIEPKADKPEPEPEAFQPRQPTTPNVPEAEPAPSNGRRL